MSHWRIGDQHFWTNPGPATDKLRAVAEKFHARVESIPDTGNADDWSWSYPTLLNKSTDTCDNHGSGTAIDLNAQSHPMGDSGTFTPAQRAEIERILSEVGDVAWGGHWTDPVDEMHFEWTAAP